MSIEGTRCLFSDYAKMADRVRSQNPLFVMVLMSMYSLQCCVMPLRQG